ncbi:MAG: Ig-like domain-containing protein [Balneolaceae bacterium]
MKSINKYLYRTVFAASLLAVVMVGCNDNVTGGIEGFCPLVESTSPLNLATGVQENAVITVTFQEKINPDTMTPEAFALTSGSAKVSSNMTSNQVAAMSGTMTFDDASNTMSFTPDAPLSSGTVYSGRINNTIEDPLGNQMLEDYVWSFTTGEALIPTVDSTDPEDEEQDVELNKIVTVTFNQAMDALSIDETTFTLFDDATQVDGTVSYNTNDATASFEPDVNLSSETLYTATITTGAEDENGTALENDYVWSFTTGDALIPTVDSTDPEDQEQDVELNKIVTAIFSQSMDALTIDETTFTLFDDVTQIDGTVSYNTNDITASFEPDVDLSSGTTYTATITTGAEDENGIALENDYVWSFTTPSQEQIVLGTAETYGIMATSAITNTGNTVINGDVSLDPGTSMTGFPPGIVNGTTNINNTESAQARADLLEAYDYYKNLPPGTTIAAGADLGALYPNGIAPGTYTSGSTMLVSTPLVLDAGGDPNAVWVFQIGSSLTTEADVTLANGANEKNVFWVPTEDATIGVATTFHGTIVSGRDVTANTGAVINGRILAGAINAGTIALDSNTVNVPGFQQ